MTAVKSIIKVNLFEKVRVATAVEERHRTGVFYHDKGLVDIIVSQCRPQQEFRASCSWLKDSCLIFKSP